MTIHSCMVLPSILIHSNVPVILYGASVPSCTSTSTPSDVGGCRACLLVQYTFPSAPPSLPIPPAPLPMSLHPVHNSISSSEPPCHLPIPPAPLPMSPHPCTSPSAPPKPPCHHPNLPVIFPASLFPSHILVPFCRLLRSLPVISPASLFPSYVSVHFRRFLRSLLVIL